jgi:hypothetical protein
MRSGGAGSGAAGSAAPGTGVAAAFGSLFCPTFAAAAAAAATRGDGEVCVFRFCNALAFISTVMCIGL